MSDVLDRELNWDDEIEKESEFLLLPEGDYPFEIVQFERGRHGGSAKLPPCNKAVLHVRITAPEGTITLHHNLFLHTKTESMLSAFFASIGRKKKGERLKMNWAAVVGSTGRLKLGIRSWRGNDGEERQSNEIKRFYPYEADEELPAGMQPLGDFTAGEF